MIQESGAYPANSELKELVAEASRSLALLDAPRLEELARCCQALILNFDPNDVAARLLLARQAVEAESEMAVFARVLEATRSNRNLIHRLRELRAGRVEYTEHQAHGMAEARHGDD